MNEPVSALGLFKGTDDRPRSPPTPRQCVQDRGDQPSSRLLACSSTCRRASSAPQPLGIPFGLLLEQEAAAPPLMGHITSRERRFAEVAMFGRNAGDIFTRSLPASFKYECSALVQADKQPFILPMLFHFPAL